MHLTLSHALLLKATDLVAKVADKHHRFEILGNIKLDLTETVLTLTASDLEVELATQVNLPDGACLVAGAMTVPAGKFHEICKSLPKGGTVTIQSLDDNKCLIESGKSRFTLSTLPALDFPSIGVPKQGNFVAIHRGELLGMLAHTKFCMASQDVRHYLTGMLFHIDQNKLALVATDGHRLALSETVLADSYDERQIIVPGKAVLELERLFGELGKTTTKDDVVNLGLDGEFLQVRLQFGDEQSDALTVALTARLIEGKFPDYKRVIPSNCNKSAHFDKDVIVEVLRRVAILSNERSRGVILEFEGETATIRASTGDGAGAVESFGIRYEGEPIEISLNETYLKAAFGALTGELCLQMSQPNSPTLITQVGESRYRYVVMPMRI